MTGVLAARRWWCRQGEPILWVQDGTLHAPEFEVDGLERNGDPQRGFGKKALRAVGKGALYATVGVAAVVDAATGDDNYGDSARDLPVVTGKLTVFGPGPECLAVRAVRPWRKKQLPGWEELRGWWVLTPDRLGWLVPTGATERLARQEEKGKPSFAGNVVRAATDMAVGVTVETVKAFGNISDHPAGKPVDLPEVTAGVEIARADLRRVDVVFQADARKPEEAPCFLQVALADGSGYRFGLGRGPGTAQLVRSWIAGR